MGRRYPQARQMFHDQNLLGVVVAKTQALSCDTRDFGTLLAEAAATRTMLNDGNPFSRRWDRYPNVIYAMNASKSHKCPVPPRGQGPCGHSRPKQAVRKHLK